MEMVTFEPSSHEEIKEYLSHPKSHSSIVVYKMDNILMILNPFGGGLCTTNELVLSEHFDFNTKDLKSFCIITEA